MLPRQMLGSFLFMFSSRCYIVSDLIFKALINVKLIFCELCNIELKVILLVDIHLPTPFFEKRLTFPASILGSFIKYQLTVYLRVYFQALESAPSVYVFVFLQQHCILFLITIVLQYSLIRNCDNFSFAFFFFFCRLVWLFEVICGSISNLGLCLSNSMKNSI